MFEWTSGKYGDFNDVGSRHNSSIMLHIGLELNEAWWEAKFQWTRGSGIDSDELIDGRWF